MLISIISAFLFTASVVSSTSYFDLNINQLSYNNVPKNVFIATSIGGSSVSLIVLGRVFFFISLLLLLN